ncbi:6-hydroxy-D-nicotine oxidase [Nemania sp. FL0916]|nr:6-hydroxy-D-nicotine oxidase [Nemania sp. FL0916]
MALPERQDGKTEPLAMELAVSLASRAQACCSALQTALPHLVILGNHPQYEAEKYVPWSQTCWLPATCFVRPTTPQDVAEALKIIQQTGSKFAIRCGGHNPNQFFSSINDSGILIDVSELKTLSLGADGVLQMGAGNRWGDVYTYLEKHGLSPIGGRQNDVGVSGYLLGGGMPAFLALHGFAADQVQNFEVVLADGTIINANAKENSELWQALKGGGPNFGIVTRFDIQTYPTIKAQYTVNTYDPSDYVNIMNATADLQEAMESDPKLGAFVYINPTFIAVGLFYAEWVEERPKAFNTFFNLKSLVAVAVPTTNGTMKDLVAAVGAGANDPPLRRQYASQSSKVSVDLYIKVYEVYQEIVQKYGEATNLSYSLQPAPTAAIKLGQSRGGNIMGLEEVPQTWWAFVSQWDSPTNDTRAQQAIDELYQGMQKVSREQEQWLDFVFMNEGKGTQDVLGSYGEANVQKMQKVQSKHDPEKVFQNLQNDGYLLRKVRQF